MKKQRRKDKRRKNKQKVTRPSNEDKLVKEFEDLERKRRFFPGEVLI